MKEREVYPNAPIVLVAVEVRHPVCEPLDRKQVAELSARIKKLLPLPGEIDEVSVVVQSGASSFPMPSQTTASTWPRWTSRNKRTALTVRHDSLVLETTEYGSYERVRGLLELALEGRLAAGVPAGVERVGLRYIDEVRVPLEEGEDIPAWREWVDPSLLGPEHLAVVPELVPVRSEGLLVCAGNDNRALVVRYGAQNEHVVPSTPELRRTLPPGPLFKLDFDSFWQAGDEVPEFDADFVLRQVDALHEPVRYVFESLITERLREEVLRRG